MTEIIRVALTDELPQLAWPPCCPKCGTKVSLVSTTSRLGRVKSIRPNLLGGMTMKSDILYLSYPICEKHAQEAYWANMILDKSPLAQLLRLLAYFGAFFALSFIVRPKTFISDFGWFSLYPLIGLLGVAAIVWAKKATSVWPMRFDPDMDVFEIRFLDEGYASKFRLLNREATSSSLTEAPPWYMRSLIWKIVIIGIFIALMAKLMSR